MDSNLLLLNMARASFGWGRFPLTIIAIFSSKRLFSRSMRSLSSIIIRLVYNTGNLTPLALFSFQVAHLLRQDDVVLFAHVIKGTFGGPNFVEDHYLFLVELELLYVSFGFEAAHTTSERRQRDGALVELDRGLVLVHRDLGQVGLEVGLFGFGFGDQVLVDYLVGGFLKHFGGRGVALDNLLGS